jgi:hypothetical protein
MASQGRILIGRFGEPEIGISICDVMSGKQRSKLKDGYISHDNSAALEWALFSTGETDLLKIHFHFRT